MTPRIKPIRPKRSVTWRDRPNKDRPFEKERTQYRYQQERGELRPLFTLQYCTIIAVSATSDTARLSRYRYLPYDGVWHAQPTLDIAVRAYIYSSV